MVEPITDKLIFAFQFWSNDFNWYTPNGHPEDWVINGKKTLPFSHGGHYFKKLGIEGEINKIEKMTVEELKSSGLEVDKKDFLMNNKDVEIKLLENIPKGEKYIFPVIIYKINYFKNHEKIGFRYVSSRVIEDVKNGIAKIILFFPFEGNTSIYPPNFYSPQRTSGMKVIEKWCREYEFTKDQVIFIQPNMLSKKFNQKLKHFTPIGVDTFFSWVPKQIIDIDVKKILPFNPSEEKYLFLCYNRRIRTHRLFLLLKMFKSNIFNKGMISCGEQISLHRHRKEVLLYNSFELVPYISQLEKITPINIDLDLIENNPAIQLTPDHYEKTFISLITETHFESEIIFRSEKIFKTMAIGHPFIVLSSPGFLSSLNSLIRSASSFKISCRESKNSSFSI
jgi:hypothetical protein